LTESNVTFIGLPTRGYPELLVPHFPPEFSTAIKSTCSAL
jgi:hypothetical protein